VSRAWWSLIALLVVSFEIAASASDITKLAPESVVIHLQNGAGEEKVTFFKPTSTCVTKVMTTAAAGRTSTIPQSDIQATTESERDPSLFSIVVHVKTRVLMERGIPYKGIILILTQDNKPAEQIPFSVQDDTAVNIESLQAAIDAAVGPWQPDRYRLIIRNNGKTSVTSLSLSSSTLGDTSTGKRIVLDSPNTDWSNNPLEPDQERVVSLDLPRPKSAGTFVGQLYLTANDQKTIAIPINIRSRGPYGWSALPFVLFCAVLGLGFWLSSTLDDWFSGGGLFRAQAYLSLRNSQTLLVQRYADIQNWTDHLPAHVPSISVPHAEAWLQQAIQEFFPTSVTNSPARSSASSIFSTTCTQNSIHGYSRIGNATSALVRKTSVRQSAA
jgi:hypothetical protein